MTIKMLALNENVEPFLSSWGAMCIPIYDEILDKWLLPLGWESELEARGIAFEVIEIEIINEP